MGPFEQLKIKVQGDERKMTKILAKSNNNLKMCSIITELILLGIKDSSLLDMILIAQSDNIKQKFSLSFRKIVS